MAVTIKALRLPPQKTAKQIEEEQIQARKKEAIWWEQNKTDQRMLIKPCYESSKAISSKMKMHTKNEFIPYVFNTIVQRCKDVDNGIRYPESPKSEMPGFAIGSVKEDFERTSVRADNFVKTRILVLDIDDVPDEVSNIGLWLPTVLPKGVHALWYSTPRWRQDKKRIRAVIPLSREISMEEKKSLASRLKIPGVDPASFEAGKFSLLPCWCEDTVDFQWGSVGHRELDMDRDLPAWIPERKRSPAPTIRLEAAYEMAKALAEIVEKVNDAPDGGSQEVIKSNLSRAFRKYAMRYEYCEEYAHGIIREDRQRDFLGIARWLDNRYRH